MCKYHILLRRLELICRGSVSHLLWTVINAVWSEVARDCHGKKYIDIGIEEQYRGLSFLLCRAFFVAGKGSKGIYQIKLPGPIDTLSMRTVYLYKPRISPEQTEG